LRAYLRLFGGVRLDAGDATGGIGLSGPAVQKKRLALLALLSTTPTRRLSRDKAIAFLWPDSDAERGRHQLASAVYELRKALGEDAIMSTSDDLELNPAVLSSDVAEFESALTRGDRERAIELYAGPFLDGFFVPDAPELEHWIDAERKRLGQAYARALEELAEERTAQRDLLGAVASWRKLAAHDLYNSRVALKLVRALDAAGDRVAALQHVRVHTTLLREELGVEPDPDFSRLAEQLRQAPASARPKDVRHVPTAAANASEAGAVEPARPLSTIALAHSAAIDRSPSWRRRAPALAAAIAVVAIIMVVASRVGWWTNLGANVAGFASGSSHLPIVVMMDSPHPSRVYDDEVIQLSGTNADLLNDLLRDLPIQRVKEAAGPGWHRHEEIRRLDPDLVVMHLSAFCQQECEPNRVKLREFIEYLADTRTQFLIYSRMQPDSLRESFRAMLGDLPQRFPKLPPRLHLFALIEHGTPHWKDPATAAALKLRVKELLSLR